MAQPATRLTRRLVLSPPPLHPSSLTPTTIRTLTSTTTTKQQAHRTPSLADIDSTTAASFDAKQQDFRQNLKASKAKADSQSPSPMSTHPSFASASSGDHASASAAVDESASEIAAVHANSTVAALGSHGFDTGEAREAARAADDSKKTTSSSKDQSSSPKKRKGPLSSIIYGTEEGREHENELERSFSQVLARGKYVHSIVFHEVKPDKVDEYVELVGGWYPKVAADPNNKVHLVGSWRTEVGDCDTFVHIWEYERYHGYHNSLHQIQSQPAFSAFDHAMKPLITSKRTSLMQEFSFWPTTPPRQLGGLFELRSYTLHPGNLLEWETHWRKGLAARKEVMEGVGAWFVQIGDLNTVHHLWQFADLEERKVEREKSWAVEGWGDTVHQTVPLIQSMRSRVLIPMPWSPVG